MIDFVFFVFLNDNLELLFIVKIYIVGLCINEYFYNKKYVIKFIIKFIIMIYFYDICVWIS